MQNKVLVAGHLCLDIFPQLTDDSSPVQIMIPGKLTNVGPVRTATGGTVANTGLALRKLGVNTELIGKIKDDFVGHEFLRVLENSFAGSSKNILTNAQTGSSYTIVISLPGTDRIFLHFPGANDEFQSEDISKENLQGTDLFHFGYPPLMKNFYTNGGINLKALMKKAKNAGATTSLDMALPDPQSPAGQVNWESILGKSLPYVDLFLPSIDEMIQMLLPERLASFKSSCTADNPLGDFSMAEIEDLSRKILSMGCAVVGIKLGSAGFYLSSTNNRDRLANMGRLTPSDEWLGVEIHQPCFKANFVGATGAGDCTIAGFLAAWTKQMSPEDAASFAVGVGAFSVESADATGGIPDMNTVLDRINNNWDRI